MKTTVKRFSTTIIVTYRKSNSTKRVYFDTLEEAKKCVNDERNLHPRSRKFNPDIWDSEERKLVRG